MLVFVQKSIINKFNLIENAFTKQVIKHLEELNEALKIKVKVPISQITHILIFLKALKAFEKINKF